MKKNYHDVSNEQVIEKTGNTIENWVTILTAFDAKNKKSNEVVTFLQNEYTIPRYWARTLTTLFIKQE